MSRKAIAGLAVVAAAGAGLFWWGTDGFTAFTAETARRNAVMLDPRPLPRVVLEDQQGRTTSLGNYAGKVVLAEFAYTRCLTICSALGATFEQLRTVIADEGLGNRIALVTLSFDPEHDGPAQLEAYANRFGGADAIWTFARPRPGPDTRALLKAADVIVIPDGAGGFVHNAAILVIDARGRLIRILDVEDWQEALALALRQL